MSEYDADSFNASTEPLRALTAAGEVSRDPAPVDTLRRLYVIESFGVYLALDDAFSCGEVLSEPRIYPLPGCASSLLGVCHRRGDIVPIYDLEILLGADEKDSDRTQHWPNLDGHRNVHFLPVHRKMHKTYVVVMGANGDGLSPSSSDPQSINLSGSIGFALSSPPKSLALSDDEAMDLDVDDHRMNDLIGAFVKSVMRYQGVELPVIHLDWLGYCLAQVRALDSH